MSENKNNEPQYSVLCEQGDLGLWNAPLNEEDNKKVIEAQKEDKK